MVESGKCVRHHHLVVLTKMSFLGRFGRDADLVSLSARCLPISGVSNRNCVNHKFVEVVTCGDLMRIGTADRRGFAQIWVAV